MSKSTANFLQALLAVLLGNNIYFLLERYLPAGARHVPLKLDAGIVVDFLFCLAVFGIIKTVAGGKRKSRTSKS